MYKKSIFLLILLWSTTECKVLHGKTIGFIIPTYVSSEKHYIILRDGIRKIRQYHDWPIVIINDHSPLDISSISHEFPDISIELSYKKGAAEMNPYWHYYHQKYFDTAIIMHDSMHLNRALVNIEKVPQIQFLRYFTNHRVQWAIIQEPQTQYNKQFNIKNHDDLILHIIDMALMQQNPCFWQYCRNIYFDKKKWVGCWGIQSIITWDFLHELQEKTNILDFVDIIKDRRDRMAMESIFGLACLYTTNLETITNTYDSAYPEIDSHNLISEHFKKITISR